MKNCLKYILIVSIVMPIALLSENKKIINFSPLPITNTSKSIQDFLPLTSYLEKSLDISIKYLHYKNYQNIIDGFTTGTIDIAYLGPLPFIALQREYPHIKPIATINQKNGSSNYKCVLTKFKKDTIDTTKPLKVALTQPLSTCGYFMTDKLLKSNLSIELNKQKFKYYMSHTNAILSVTAGENLIAGVKDSVASRHQTIGMEIIAQSDLLPGFLLVANTKTLSNKQIEQVKQSLFNLPEESFKKWKGIFSHGFTNTDLKQYNTIEIDFDKIPLKGSDK